MKPMIIDDVSLVVLSADTQEVIDFVPDGVPLGGLQAAFENCGKSLVFVAVCNIP